MQEIISSLASVANAAVHVRYLPELLRVSLDRVRPSPARNRARLWLVNAVVNVQRMDVVSRVPRADTPRTHFMDYASANAIFFFALFAVLVRVWGRRGGRLRWPLAAAFCLWFAAHVREMNAPADGLKYQYERNMRVMMGVAVAHWSLLLLWAFLARGEGNRGSRIRAGACSSETSRAGTSPPSPRLPISRPWEAY